jgi:hypothetical protein
MRVVIPVFLAGEEILPWLDQPSENPFPDNLKNLLKWALDVGMAPRTRDEIFAEITELRKQHLEAATDAVFGGLPHEQEVERQERSERLARLNRELDILDELPDGARRV